MSYQPIESDERDSGTGLEFRSFLGNETSNAPTVGGSPSPNRGYYGEQPVHTNASGFWTIEYYQKYFDVDTKTVLTRCLTTLLPTLPSYLTAHINPAPDLYGPFWTLTTLIFSLFVFSSLASSIVSYLSASPITYDFQLLSVAVGLVYIYGIGVPLGLWAALKYLGVSEWGLVEAWSVWGYGMFVWIPVSVLCVIPVPIVRWVLVGAAFGLSGYFLIRNVYPVLASAEQKATRLFVIILVILHAAVALTFKILFFSYYVIDELAENDPLGTGPGNPNSMSMSDAMSSTVAEMTSTMSS
ncbi:hypothetical protein M422DRAFT_214747 [Sphaerobolus stellatus SS14]|uniref:Protein YIP n=1 Tax=Sphaerobolus stellatus (strain SS14) TaxID=990650 RepID=A0A0C9UX82_SPHS4|nr:hypothetical protein M422DRAFT_215328 [Sphaerobolus stellatus SS14]KIJ29936.1 hypothetical protein M422DRAFT_214747 [Sphaerobolus stellatus SS14]